VILEKELRVFHLEPQTSRREREGGREGGKGGGRERERERERERLGLAWVSDISKPTSVTYFLQQGYIYTNKNTLPNSAIP
jgi:hypothetical protein